MIWKNKMYERFDEDYMAAENKAIRKRFAWLPTSCLESNETVWLEWYWYRTEKFLDGFEFYPTRPVRKEGK